MPTQKLVRRASPPAGTPVRYPNKPGYTGFVDERGEPYDNTHGKTRFGKRKGVVAYGQRRAFAAQVRALVDQAKDVVLAEMASPQSIRDYIDTIQYGASRKVMDRACIRMKGEILKLVSAPTLVVEFVQSLGASNEDEVRRIVDAYRSAGEADSLTALERMTTAMEALLPLHEEHRAMIIRRLGGILPREGEIG